MIVLDINVDTYILRDDLSEEDLSCLLCLLRGVRNEYDGQLIDVSVGYRLPRPRSDEPRHDATWQDKPDAS